MTYPGVNGGSSYEVERDFDPMGRLVSITYNDPTNTPDVDFAYDLFGNRATMTEYNNASEGKHTEHLGHLLAEMQIVARSYPGAEW
jgi:hypothetical protein